MARFIQKLAASAALCLLLLLIGLYFRIVGLPFAHLRGTLAARWDISHGRYRILTYGLASLDRGEYARTVRDRYGVEIRTIAGCRVDDSLVDYARGYDVAMKAALQQHYKRDVLAEAASEMQMKQARLKTLH